MTTLIMDFSHKKHTFPDRFDTIAKLLGEGAATGLDHSIYFISYSIATIQKRNAGESSYTPE